METTSGFLLALTMGLAMANNFPPVQNPVPIPTPAVKIFPGPDPGFLESQRDFYPAVKDAEEFDQRWYTEAENAYIPYSLSQEEGQRDSSYEVLERLNESLFPVVGPVATPSPDESNDPNARADVSPRYFINPMALPSSDIWTRSKNPIGQYTIRRVVPVPAGSGVGKNGGLVLPLRSSVIRSEKTVPARQEFVPSPKTYPAVEIVKEFPAPRNYVPQAVISPPVVVKSQTGQAAEIVPPVVTKSEGKEPAAIPKTIVAANTSPKRPTTIVIPPKNIPVSPPLNSYIVTSNGYVSDIRSVLVPVPGKGVGIAQAVNTKKGTPLPPTDNLKSIPAVQVPAQFSVGDTWILRQDAKAPYFQNLRTLLPAVAVSNPRSSLPITVAQLKSSPVLPASVKSAETPAVVFRRGSKESKAPMSAVVVMPHSPKSDVLVIGKGTTAAHLQTQKTVLPAPGPSKKPCPIPEVPQIIPYISATRTFAPVSSKTVPITRKMAPAFQSSRAYPYVFWNPNVRPDMYYLSPQSQKRGAVPLELVPRSPSLPLTVYGRNYLQYPYSYTSPFRLGNGGYYDAQRPLRQPVRVSNPSPPPIPEIESASSSEGTSEESPAISTEKKSSAEESPTKESSEGSSVEGESTQIKSIVEAPEEAQASELRPAYATRTATTTESVKPYAFSYDEKDEQGTLQFRQESSDANGVVTGTYGVREPSGTYRQVEYVADENGYKATVKVSPQITESSTSSTVDTSTTSTSAQFFDFNLFNSYATASRPFK